MESMPKCYCAFVVLKHERKFRASECRGFFAKMRPRMTEFAKPKFASNKEKITCKPAPTQNWGINFKSYIQYSDKQFK